MAGVDRRRFLAGAGALGLWPLLSRLGGVAAATGARLQVARVAVATPAQARLLDHFDVLCGQSSPEGVDVLLWPGDGARLRAMGLDYEVIVADVAEAERHPLPTATFSAAAQPGQRPDYRRLADYERDLHDLAARFPDRARVFTLPETTLDGRQVYGLEIAGDIGRRDARPAFVMDGLHHAREWPSGEMSVMFAFDLVEGYDTDARVRALVDAVRTLVIPVVNVDGFHHSREAVFQSAPVAGLEGYWRKNRRGASHAAPVSRTTTPDAYGVDPNRNYAFLWGGIGASDIHAEETFRGDTPFSEPETRNVRSVFLAHGPTAAITNHTYGNLILRPWGHTWDDCPDEGLLRGLGDRMAAHNGYWNGKGIGLYVTTGTSEDWAYGALNTIAYTFEHGIAFHPPYADAVPNRYSANREAFLLALAAAGDPALHGLVTGRVVNDAGLRVRADIVVTREVIEAPRDPGPPSVLSIRSKAGTEGQFALHVNPSAGHFPPAQPYMVTFSAPAHKPTTKQFEIARGQRVDLGSVVLARA